MNRGFPNGLLKHHIDGVRISNYFVYVRLVSCNEARSTLPRRTRQRSEIEGSAFVLL